jgi:homoserine O-acetyltransferase/O-succinyltransferase
MGAITMTGQGGDWPVADGVLDLGDLPVERGGVITDARLAWQSHGTLNEARDNVIVHPPSYTATHEDLAWLIGPDGVLDPSRWFIVIPDIWGHRAGSPEGIPADLEFLTGHVRAWLDG